MYYSFPQTESCLNEAIRLCRYSNFPVACDNFSARRLDVGESIHYDLTVLAEKYIVVGVVKSWMIE
jgi:hypothetical protein